MIRLIKNDEEINNFSSNLDFHINTLVPTNSPNIQLQKEVYLFDIVKEKEEVSCEKQSKNVKNILISHIQV